MQTADVAIGVLAVIALLGTFVGVALYEPPESFEFNVVQTTSTRDVGSKSLSLQGPGAEDDDQWAVPDLNVTEAHFEATLTGSGQDQLRTQAITVQVEITAPNGATQDETLTIDSGNPSATVPLHFMFDMTEYPSTLEGGNVTDAAYPENENADRLPDPDTNATGTWNVTATIQSAGAQTPPVVGNYESVTVQVTMTITKYVLELNKKVPGGDLSPAA